MVQVKVIQDQAEMLQAFEIRRLVFVIEQAVAPEEEYDEYEDSCIHFLATKHQTPVGTARIRKTEKGYKLERFAVLKEHRGTGVGAALVQACLDHPWLLDSSKYVYMHAQEHALEFYRKLGFTAVGERFMECDIAHFTMYLSR